MALDTKPHELSHFEKLENILILSRWLFNKIAVMHRNSKFSKIKGNIRNIPVDATNIYNILPRPAVFNGLIVVKL